MILWTLRILGPFAFFACAAAQKPTNHTIDDKDPMVIVYGQCDLYNSTLDYRGSHIIGTGDDSRVVFTFEGVGVYLLGPMLPTLLDCSVQLDGGESHLVNMTNPNGVAVKSNVLWGVTELSNGRHELVVKRGTTNQFYADAFIYTSQDGTPVSLPSTTPTTVALAVAISAFIASIFLIIAIAFILIHRRRREKLAATIVPFARANDTPEPEKEIKHFPRRDSPSNLAVSKPSLPTSQQRSMATTPLTVEQSSRTVFHKSAVPPTIGHSPHTTPTNTQAVPSGRIPRLGQAQTQRRWSDQSLRHLRQVSLPGHFPITTTTRIEPPDLPPSYLPPTPRPQ